MIRNSNGFWIGYAILFGRKRNNHAGAKKLIWNTLNVVASYKDKSFRRMTNLVNAIQSVELKARLQPLTISGAYGEIFDADTDSLQLSS